MAYLDAVFTNAKRVNQSVIILDDFENLLGADAELRNYSNVLRLKFESLLKDMSESDTKCIVIATVKNPTFIKRVELYHLFDEYAELGSIKLTIQNACSILGKLQPETKFVLSANENAIPTIDISIRQLVYALKKYSALTEEDALDVGKFMETLSASMPKQKNNTELSSSRDGLYSLRP